LSSFRALLVRAKVVMIPLLNKSYRLRWDAASITRRQAFMSVCATSNEEEIDKLGRADAERIIPFLTESSIILDVGCGVGRLEKQLCSYCREIYAFDVSHTMLKIARRRLEGISNVRLQNCNAARKIPFPEAMFDLCFSFHCLQHMEKEDSYLALKEIHRVLKPSAIAILHFPSFTSRTYYSLFKEMYNKRDNARVRSFTEPEVRTILTDVGFSDLKVEYTCLNRFVKPEEDSRDMLVTARS